MAAKKIHYHQKNKALTACGRPWLSFWDEPPENNWSRGSLPYGESSTTDSKVTCQECLEARYKIKSKELEELHERIDIFWDGKRPKKKVTAKKFDKSAFAIVFGKRMAAFALSELKNLGYPED